MRNFIVFLVLLAGCTEPLPIVEHDTLCSISFDSPDMLEVENTDPTLCQMPQRDPYEFDAMVKWPTGTMEFDLLRRPLGQSVGASSPGIHVTYRSPDLSCDSWDGNILLLQDDREHWTIDFGMTCRTKPLTVWGQAKGKIR